MARRPLSDLCNATCADQRWWTCIEPRNHDGLHLTRLDGHEHLWYTDARPLCLDLFCGAGGSAKGYADKGYRVIGVDTDPLMLKRYPYEGYLEDAVAVLSFLCNGHSWQGYKLSDFALVHASPPCEAYSATARIGNSNATMLIAETRRRLARLGRPYVIENVPGARDHMLNPVTLCGGMFPELQVYRHRLFEASFNVPQRPHQPHWAKQPKMGRPVERGEFIQVVGHFANADYAREAMGICWMGRDQLKEAVPPAYTRYIAHFAPNTC